MKLEGLSIIGQRRVTAAGKPIRPSIPRAARRSNRIIFGATTADVDAAAQLAAKAFATFSNWPAIKRAGLLRRIAELLEANAPAIVERANLETALPVARLQGELARTCFQLRLYGESVVSGLSLDARIDHARSESQTATKPDLRSMLRPLGPVVVFRRDEFPLAYSVAGGDTASALAAGCPVIVKPNQGHLGTSELVALLIQQAARECEAPDGIFSMIYGAGRRGRHRAGETSAGKSRWLHRFAQRRTRVDGRGAARPEPIPVYAEMGSINPVFIFARAR